MARAEGKHMYSWWWDSHISPKNSKWLAENLTDMDSRVRIMIKLIEVDEDSFATRAEMYYKKRPELMKLVEEVYRAYRALAERYDHATGVIHHAQKTMDDNKISFVMTQDGPVNSTNDYDPRTPEIQAPGRGFLDLKELQKDLVELSSSDLTSHNVSGNLTSESDSLGCRNGAKQLNGSGKARKSLNFQGSDEICDGVQKNEKHQGQTQDLSESERLGRSASDIQALKDVLVKLESEKEVGVLQYQQTVERLSRLESEFSQAKENLNGFNERASKAEAKVQSFKEAVADVEAEREASLSLYQQCLERISNLENHFSNVEENAGQPGVRACRPENKPEILKEELSQLKTEKDALLAKYMEALEKIANLENKLLLAEDYASSITERAERAENEVETLREMLVRLTEEKQAAVLKCEQCFERIATREHDIMLIEEEAERLKAEVQDGAVKLKVSEEKCLLLDSSNKSLLSEVDSLEQKVRTQDYELSEKQKELGRLWTCVQEERMRFIEAEASFQSLQNLHSKFQEELRTVAAELHKKVQVMKKLEEQNQLLDAEVQKIKDENNSLNDINLSSVFSLKSMQEELLGIKDREAKLKQELELQQDQKTALQQEICCLKEEVNSLSLRHQHVLRQVESVGFDVGSFCSSVKELQFDNSKLKESCKRSDTEIALLVEKLGVMEKLVQKNEFVENSLADLSTELEGARLKVRELEEVCHLLMGEKSALETEKGTLSSQLQTTTENLEEVSQKNTLLMNSLFDVNAELEMLRVKFKILEDSCNFLNDENSVLVTEKQTLASVSETTQNRLEDLGRRHGELGQRYVKLEVERELTLRRVEEFQVCLDYEKREHAISKQLSQAQMGDLESQICQLQEAGNHMKEVFEEELDKAVNAQFEIFILRKSIQDLKESNSLLLDFCETLMEAFRSSEKVISELEQESLGHQDEISGLSCQIDTLRTGMFLLLDAFETDAGPVNDGYNNKDQRVIDLIWGKLDDIKASLLNSMDENQQLVIEKFVLVEVIRKLKLDVADMHALIIAFWQDIGSRNGQVLLLQKEMQKLLESNKELILKVREGNQKETFLLIEIESLQGKLSSLQRAYEHLQKENCKIIEEKRSLINAFEILQEKKYNLENVCSCMVEEVVESGNLSFIFKNVISEKSEKVLELTEILELCSDNNVLEEKVKVMERDLEVARTKSINFELFLKKTECDLEGARVLNDQLKAEIANVKDLLCLKEMELLESESVKLIQVHRIRELSENRAQQLKQCEELRQLIQNLDLQTLKMQKGQEESGARVQVLNAELLRGKDEAKLWETVAGTSFAELQSSSVKEAFIKATFEELVKAYDALEEDGYSKGMDIAQLRERVGALECENSKIKAQLADDLSAIVTLNDSVASLEKHAIWGKKLHRKEIQENEEIEVPQNSKEQSGGFVNIQEVLDRIQGVEKAVTELKQHAEEEYIGVRSDLDSALRQLEALKSRSSSRRGSWRLSRRVMSHPWEDLKNGSVDEYKQKINPNPFETGEELTMKDIMLDQASDCSSSGRNREVLGSDDQIIELWETVDNSGSINLTVANSYRATPVGQNKYSHHDSVKEKKSSWPSSETAVVRELTVDEQMSSKRFRNPQQDDRKRKTLERLASDVQKLTNLQIAVQDLKEKLEMMESNSRKGRVVANDGVKEQILKTEQAILKLFDYSTKVMKNIDKSSSASSSMSSLSFDGLSVVESVDGENGRRKKNMDQARRISEKIERLQLEVQKVQLLLIKLDNSKSAKVGGTRIMERKTRVLLGDYLYSGTRISRRRKIQVCGCVHPRTKE